MKLFDNFEAVIFPEENMILVTKGGFLYYIYNIKDAYWKKYSDAGNTSITVANYRDISREMLMKAMQGIFPKKETDFLRLCKNIATFNIGNMIDLLQEDYEKYLLDYSVIHVVGRFLEASDICYKSFLELRKLLDNAMFLGCDKDQVLQQIKELSYTIIGRDIFKKEIGIVDGHDSSSYFWIRPVRVIDYANTNNFDNVAKMQNVEISIEEEDVLEYLTPFLYKHYDDGIKANKRRVEFTWVDDDGNEQTAFVSGFEWYLTHNFFTFDSMLEIIKDMNDTIDALSSGRDNDFTAELRKKRCMLNYELPEGMALSEEAIKAYKVKLSEEDSNEIDLIIDFYRRFIYRIEYMIKVGEEKGYNLISIMGP